ncbi:hypothetical protein [Leptolyngbya sp. 7M]|uniref:hypothetical protein n=1 Tax=Leptolyngbya sp. 7M TaxID=2812896 RepID=UPI001B8C8426|nr:hypothetical protein [Leptolyngbya sp. 7M]QYO64235.1 hypothetical protein JVX88_31650 [Leptolyngbya sp. 7M]
MTQVAIDILRVSKDGMYVVYCIVTLITVAVVLFGYWARDVSKGQHLPFTRHGASAKDIAATRLYSQTLIFTGIILCIVWMLFTGLSIYIEYLAWTSHDVRLAYQQARAEGRLRSGGSHVDGGRIRIVSGPLSVAGLVGPIWSVRWAWKAYLHVRALSCR